MHNRGGICFELNGLYNWLLESLGFEVTSYAARFIDKMETYQLRRHRVMCVALGEKLYLTDVGVNSESRVYRWKSRKADSKRRHQPIQIYPQ